MPNYYTLQIRYGDSKDPSIEQWKDLTPEGKDLMIWIAEQRRTLFTTGFTKPTGTGSFELISPFRIHGAMMLLQPEGKHGQ